MAGHRGTGPGDSEPQGSEPHFTITRGGVATPVAGFANGLPGDPPMPKIRGNAKDVASSPIPNSAKKASNSGPLTDRSSFGLGGSGGRKG